MYATGQGKQNLRAASCLSVWQAQIKVVFIVVVFLFVCLFFLSPVNPEKSKDLLADFLIYLNFS